MAFHLTRPRAQFSSLEEGVIGPIKLCDASGFNSAVWRVITPLGSLDISQYPQTPTPGQKPVWKFRDLQKISDAHDQWLLAARLPSLECETLREMIQIIRCAWAEHGVRIYEARDLGPE